MKKVLILLFFILFIFSFQKTYTQGQWKAEDIWVTDIATVEFDRGKIYYVFDQKENSSMMPMNWYSDLYQFRNSFNPERRSTRNRYLNLDYIVESFEVEESDRYDKIQFIKAAALELIWSSDYVDLVSDETIKKLKLLTKDENIDVSFRAKKSIAMYHRMEFYRQRDSSFSKYIHGFLITKIIDDKVEVKLEFIQEEKGIEIKIFNSKGEVMYSKILNKEDLKYGFTTNLEADIYYIHLYFNHKKMESQKFTVVK